MARGGKVGLVVVGVFLVALAEVRLEREALGL